MLTVVFTEEICGEIPSVLILGRVSTPIAILLVGIVGIPGIPGRILGSILIVQGFRSALGSATLGLTARFGIRMVLPRRFILPLRGGMVTTTTPSTM